MGDLTPEAQAEIRAAVAIVRADKTGAVNAETYRKIVREELAAIAPKPADPPTPPTPPTPPVPPGPTPPPPTPPVPPVPPAPVKRRSRYWPEDD